ncbi:uncharacterized protein CEXT_638231 [Caerostris extrusa]|uniref:Uncharacterized protein n=1 Tax=Caerostris extrusa TaxID=172846 RepID=A0AAV4XF95_CAEEX|nr:uncharacterized protein CEXT_638231 [Caerostris extrusa]
MYPLSLRWTKSRGPIIMIVIWGSAVGLSSFQLIHGKAEKFVVSGHEFYDCTEVWEEFDGKVQATEKRNRNLRKELENKLGDFKGSVTKTQLQRIQKGRTGASRKRT